MERHLTFGIDIGGTRSKYGLVDVENGVILYQTIWPTERDDSTQFLANLQKACLECCRAASVNPTSVVGVGIGVPGFTRQGMVQSTWGALTFMESYPLARFVTEMMGCPCRIDNDARLIALAESRYGSARGYDRALTLTLGTGVGFGFVCEGELFDREPRAHMGGHIPIRNHDQTCYCGIGGCFEQLVSASGLIRLIRKRKDTADLQDLPALFRAERAKHPIAQRIVTQFLSDLARGLTAYINVLTPDVTVLGGGLSQELPPYLERIQAQIRTCPFEGYHYTLVCSAIQEQSGILGAATLFRDAL
jgi:glucokinase